MAAISVQFTEVNTKSVFPAPLKNPKTVKIERGCTGFGITFNVCVNKRNFMFIIQLKNKELEAACCTKRDVI